MADLPQQDTIKQYLLDGVQTTFTVPFYVPLEPDDDMPNLDVYLTPVGQPPVPESDLLVWSTDYTYSPNLDPITGGTLTLIASQATGDVLTIVRDVQAALDVEFSNAQTFNGQNLDDALDKLLLIEQQNKTYALQRNLSYVVNSYLPDASLQAQVQIPVLEDGQIWMGTGVGVIAVTLEQSSDVSTLRSELANEAPTTNGARLVGYYDVVNSNPTTVKEFLENIWNSPTIETPNITGVTNASNAATGSVGEFMSSQVLYSSAINFHNGDTAEVTYLDITAGDWDVWGNVVILDPNNQLESVSAFSNSALSSVDASLTSGFNAGSSTPNLNIYQTPILTRRYNVSTTTRIYLLVGAFTASAGTMAASGGLYARRVR